MPQGDSCDLGGAGGRPHVIRVVETPGPGTASAFVFLVSGRAIRPKRALNLPYLGPDMNYIGSGRC